MSFLQTNPNGRFYGKQVLVTGAAGFIGSHVARALLAEGCSVLGCVRSKGDNERLRDVHGDLNIFPLDLGSFDAKELLGLKFKPEWIFHLGAYGVGVGQNDPALMTAVNVRGTRELLEYAQAIRVERFIHCGSCFEYSSGVMLTEDVVPRPISEYGASKVIAGELVQQFCRQKGLPAVTLRPFTVYGPGEDCQRLVSSVIHAVLSRTSLKLTSGEQTRDFVFIDDVVAAFLAAAVEQGVIAETFNVAAGVETSVKTIVLKIMDLMGSKFVPEFGVLPHRPSEYRRLSGDPAKAAAQLHWRASTSLEDGLRATIAWISAQEKY